VIKIVYVIGTRQNCGGHYGMEIAALSILHMYVYAKPNEDKEKKRERERG